MVSWLRTYNGHFTTNTSLTTTLHAGLAPKESPGLGFLVRMRSRTAGTHLLYCCNTASRVRHSSTPRAREMENCRTVFNPSMTINNIFYVLSLRAGQIRSLELLRRNIEFCILLISVAVWQHPRKERWAISRCVSLFPCVCLLLVSVLLSSNRPT